MGENVKENPGFNHTVKMWVFEELVDGKKLTEIINETHENVKYLKGFPIPDNVVSHYGSVGSECIQPVLTKGGDLNICPPPKNKLGGRSAVFPLFALYQMT